MEQCFFAKSSATIDALLAADYAQGIISVHWEKNNDDAVLARLSDPSFGRGDASRILKLYDIMGTNNIVSLTTILDGIQIPIRHGFFPLLSRANHSCTPSTRIYSPDAPFGKYYPSENEVTVYTTRPVRAGEELTFDYLRPLSLAVKRQELLNEFGFHCQCDHCVR